jgi:hypothetical protein
MNVTEPWISHSFFSKPVILFCESAIHPPPEIVSSVSAIFIIFLGFLATTFWNTAHNHQAIHICYQLMAVNGLSSVLNHWTGYQGWSLLDGNSMQVMGYVAATMMFESIFHHVGLVVMLKAWKKRDDEGRMEGGDTNLSSDFKSVPPTTTTTTTPSSSPSPSSPPPPPQANESQDGGYENETDGKPKKEDADGDTVTIVSIESDSDVTMARGSNDSTRDKSKKKSKLSNSKPKTSSHQTPLQNSNISPPNNPNTSALNRYLTPLRPQNPFYLLSKLIPHGLWFFYLTGLSSQTDGALMAGLTVVMTTTALILSLNTLYKPFLRLHPQGILVSRAAHLGSIMLGGSIGLWVTYEKVLCVQNPQLWSLVPIHAVWHVGATYGMYLMLQALVVLDGPRCGVFAMVRWPEKTEVSGVDNDDQDKVDGYVKVWRRFTRKARRFGSMFAFIVDWQQNVHSPL